MIKRFIIFLLAIQISAHASDFQKLETIDDVIDSFEYLRSSFIATKDHRLVFVSTYKRVTQEIKQELGKNTFESPKWVNLIIVDFANLYLKALGDYYQNKPLAGAWQEAFRSNDEKYHKVSVDLLLSMNAHISHDLPISLFNLFQAGYGPSEVKKDYFKMNEIIERLIPSFILLMSEIEKTLGQDKKGLKEWVGFYFLKKMRSSAWDEAINLYNTLRHDQPAYLEKIDRQSSESAKLITNGRFFIPSH